MKSVQPLPGVILARERTVTINFTPYLLEYHIILIVFNYFNVYNKF